MVPKAECGSFPVEHKWCVALVGLSAFCSRAAFIKVLNATSRTPSAVGTFDFPSIPLSGRKGRARAVPDLKRLRSMSGETDERSFRFSQSPAPSSASVTSSSAVTHSSSRGGGSSSNLESHGMRSPFRAMRSYSSLIQLIIENSKLRHRHAMITERQHNYFFPTEENSYTKCSQLFSAIMYSYADRISNEDSETLKTRRVDIIQIVRVFIFYI